MLKQKKMIVSVVAALSAFTPMATTAGQATATGAAAIHFEKKKTVFGGQALTIEIADTDERRERGLMERRSMSDAAGMLFIFPKEEVLSFWMKNTLIPLSIGYFDKSGKLFQILDMDPASPVELSPKLYISAKPAKFALEMNKGWFKKYKVGVGTQLDLWSLKEAK